jgi:hypothetical protein
MFVEPVYKGHRIQVDAVQIDGRWDATVNIHRVFSDDKPHVERVTCRKLTAELAERRAAIWPGAGSILTDGMGATSNCQILRRQILRH